MRIFLFIFAFFVASFSFAKELEISILMPDSVKVDQTLDSTTRVSFYFPNSGDVSNAFVTYGIDGNQGSFMETKNQPYLELITTEGSHNLQFYYTFEYQEVYTSINVEAGNHYYYTVHFQSSEIMIMSEKPVIYLYPEEEKDIHVEVKPTGEFTFTYPAYDNGWNVTATPDGKLKINEEIYNYLFWEASERISPNDINTNTGFVVPGENITAFLEEKLTLAGLNGNERADFITFWGPRMTTHSDVFLQFHFNKQCDRFGELKITPKPDSVYRIYVIWQPVDRLMIAPSPQEIPKIDRSGFSALEWGGQELPSAFNINPL